MLIKALRVGHHCHVPLLAASAGTLTVRLFKLPLGNSLIRRLTGSLPQLHSEIIHPRRTNVPLKFHGRRAQGPIRRSALFTDALAGRAAAGAGVWYRGRCKFIRDELSGHCQPEWHHRGRHHAGGCAMRGGSDRRSGFRRALHQHQLRAAAGPSPRTLWLPLVSIKGLVRKPVRKRPQRCSIA